MSWGANLREKAKKTTKLDFSITNILLYYSSFELNFEGLKKLIIENLSLERFVLKTKKKHFRPTITGYTTV